MNENTKPRSTLSAMQELSVAQRILSNDYADFISMGYGQLYDKALSLADSVINRIGLSYYGLHINRNEIPSINIQDFPYLAIPKCYGLMNETSLEQSGILTVQNYPELNLKGNGIIIGFVDTGINYTNPAFLDLFGNSRILAIWDQTISDGPAPEGLEFGTLYTKEDLDDALQSENPFERVPSRDTNGHGTFLASVAAGSPNEIENFTGAAPEADIVVVKCKEAKAYLKEYYRIPPDSIAYQENDLIIGIRFLLETARQQQKPIVICLGMGTNLGDHTGSSPLGSYLNDIVSTSGVAVSVCTGNEAAAQHHYHGTPLGENQSTDVEIRVPENSYGFTLELWATAPDLYTVSIIAPSGETIPRIPARLDQNDVYRFIFEPTTIAVDYRIAEQQSGDQLIHMRFSNPSAGIWRVRVFGNATNIGTYDMWLPITAFLNGETIFLQPDPLITLTEPSPADAVISVGAYNAVDVSLYLESGRGFTRTGRIKPEFASPGVTVQGTVNPNIYEEMSGTSIAAALTAGALALLFQWAITVNDDPALVTTARIKNYLIRGADRKDFLTYPNEEWGYGSLNLYQTLQRLSIQ